MNIQLNHTSDNYKSKNIPFRFSIRYSHIPNRIKIVEIWLNRHHWSAFKEINKPEVCKRCDGTGYVCECNPLGEDLADAACGRCPDCTIKNA